MIMKDLLTQEDFEKTQLKNLSNDEDINMSPELYYKLEGRHKEQEIDGKKNDLFSLGATFLKLGNGKSI